MILEAGNADLESSSGIVASSQLTAAVTGPSSHPVILGLDPMGTKIAPPMDGNRRKHVMAGSTGPSVSPNSFSPVCSG